MSKHEDFIHTWHIPEFICDGIVEFYNENKINSSVGETTMGIKPEIKESHDLAIEPNFREAPFNDYQINLQKCLDEYIKTFPILESLNKYRVIEGYNVQHYPIGGGFKRIHCERTGIFDQTIKRVFVFMTYLNDVDDGGTEFVYQKRIVKAQKGKTVIFPADWTHTHVGQISKTKEKTIVTGWFSHVWDLI